MNWQLMFTVLAVLLLLTSMISWLVYAEEPYKRANGKPKLILATVVTVLAVICAAMAGLLS